MTTRCTKVVAQFLCATTLLALPALAQISVPSETIPGTFDADKNAAAMRTLAAELMAAEGKAELAGLSVLPGVEVLDKLAAADPDAGRLLVGESLPLEAPVRFTNLANKMVASQSAPIAGGMLHKRADGFVWHTVVSSEGAKALRLHFTDVNLPRGAELYVYSEHEAYGPYVGKGLFGDGEFWSHVVMGSEIRLQLRFQGRQVDRAMAASQLTLADVVYLGDKFFIADWIDPSGSNDKAFCSFNASCVQNASCSSIPSAIQPAANAVAHLQFSIGGSSYICSGGLLNDTDTSTTKPYLLTANHCFSTSSAASSLAAFFQFTTSCGGSCGSASGNQVNGSTLRATNSTSDYTLVELSGTPSGATLLGWTTTAVANSNGTNLYRISHPKGAPQAYSRHSVDTSAGTCSGIGRGNWIYSRDTFGATEGGSSGSVVLNSSGQVVGQLTGACGSNTGNPCDSSSNATIDGALAAYFSAVEQYLDPDTGGCTHSGSPGGANYCSTSCPCEDGFGDCDSNAECVSGTTCVSNVGPNYGWASWVDVCEGSAPDPNSCVGNCGGQAPGGCWCDSSCSFYGDCCADKTSVCG